MSFIDIAEAPLRCHKTSFERHKSIKDMRLAMKKQGSIVDHMLSNTFSRSNIHASKEKLTDTLRQTVRNTMVFHLNKAMGSSRTLSSTVASAAKAVGVMKNVVKKISIEEEPTSPVATIPKLIGHDDHIEEIRQAVIRLVADGEVKLEISEGERVSYDHQGDLKFYTDENLKQRLALRVDPILCRLSKMFWLMIVKPEINCMEYEGYQTLMLRIHKVLIELFDLEESKVLIHEDWVRDTNATHSLTYELFHLSLFELIDIWCDSLHPDDYCNLLYLLMNGIAFFQSGSFRLKRLQDINYSDIVEELHVNPLSSVQIEEKLDEIDQKMEEKVIADVEANAAPPPPDPAIELKEVPAENLLPGEPPTHIVPDAQPLMPNLMVNDIDDIVMKPAKLHKVRMVSHMPATPVPDFKPDYIPPMKPEEPRNDTDLYTSLIHAPSKQKQTIVVYQSPPQQLSPTIEAPQQSPHPPTLPTQSSTTNRKLSQAIRPTDMSAVLANATTIHHATSIPRVMEPHIRHSSLAKHTQRKSTAVNPNLKDPSSRSYEKRISATPSPMTGFSIRSFSGVSTTQDSFRQPITNPEPSILPPTIIAPPSPSPSESELDDSLVTNILPRKVSPQMSEEDGIDWDNEDRDDEIATKSTVQFTLAGAKSPRGHPVRKPKHRKQDENRFGKGIMPSDMNSNGEAFAVKGLGGMMYNSITEYSSRYINYTTKPDIASMNQPLTGNGIGITGGKPTYKPPKDFPSRPITGIVMAKKDGPPVPYSSSPLIKMNDARSAMPYNTIETTEPLSIGGMTKKGRNLAKKAGAFASEMVQDLAVLSFGTPKNLAMAHQHPPSIASFTSTPVSPTVKDVGDLRLGNSTAYSKIYQGGQRLMSHLASQQDGHDSFFDGQLVATKTNNLGKSTAKSTPHPPNRRPPPTTPSISTQAFDQSVSNLKLNVQALGSPAKQESPRSKTIQNSANIRKGTMIRKSPPNIEAEDGIGLTAKSISKNPR